MSNVKDDRPDANRDPITGAPGAHPVGTGIGAAVGGMAAGAAAGTVAGPVGTLVGAAAGAIAGGLAGKATAEHFDPTVEDAYWRENFRRESYYQKDMTYDDYLPAYRTGWEARMKHKDRNFDEIESDLARSYEGTRGNSRLGWERGKPAARAAWDRVKS